jgi:hypothetical protein
MQSGLLRLVGLSDHKTLEDFGRAAQDLNVGSGFEETMIRKVEAEEAEEKKEEPEEMTAPGGDPKSSTREPALAETEDVDEQMGERPQQPKVIWLSTLPQDDNSTLGKYIKVGNSLDVEKLQSINSKKPAFILAYHEAEGHCLVGFALTPTTHRRRCLDRLCNFLDLSPDEKQELIRTQRKLPTLDLAMSYIGREGSSRMFASGLFWTEVMASFNACPTGNPNNGCLEINEDPTATPPAAVTSRMMKRQKVRMLLQARGAPPYQIAKVRNSLTKDERDDVYAIVGTGWQTLLRDVIQGENDDYLRESSQRTFLEMQLQRLEIAVGLEDRQAAGEKCPTLVYAWLDAFFAANNIAPERFFLLALLVLEKTLPKRNCLLLVGVANAWKSTLAHLFLEKMPCETLVSSASDRFSFARLLRTRYCHFDEPRIPKNQANNFKASNYCRTKLSVFL